MRDGFFGNAFDVDHNGEADFDRLCEILNNCIYNAGTCNGYVDDTNAEQKIFRPFGRIEIIDRGYGTEAEDVGHIICEYIFGVAGFQW